LPQCAGAIDGSFISMLRPPGKFGYRYWSYKHNNYAILLLAVVDAASLFTYVNVGKPATVGDSATFQVSPLKAALEAFEVLPMELAIDVMGVPVRPYIVADSAFALSPYMMKPYPGEHLPGSVKRVYNKHHCQTRRVVENAFGRLKGRWTALTMSRLRDPLFMSIVTRLACALHNIAQRMNDPCSPSWQHAEPNEDGLDASLRTRAAELDNAFCYFSEGVLPEDSPLGSDIRDALADHLVRYAEL
jgi:hypothetical protein